MILYIILTFLLSIIIGIILGFYIKHKSFESVGKTAQKVLDASKKEADKARKETIMETKKEILQLKEEANNEVKEIKKEGLEIQERLMKREEMQDRRASKLDQRELKLDDKESRLDTKKAELEQERVKVQDIIDEQTLKLVQISGISKEQAQSEIMKIVEDDMANEIATYMNDRLEEAKFEADKKAVNILANAIEKYANEVTNERTVSVIDIPNDEMKGRIIGREGRNIRAIETLTGVDLIIDDTPEAVIISGFDPIRKEIAKRTLTSLVGDGRIHPARIEELVEKNTKEVDKFIREKGEEAIFKTGIGKVHPDLVKHIGRLYFRTSYGQNALSHSIEVAILTGKMAAEIGENETLAKRAGLFHDIGKAMDHEVEGSHVEIGKNLAIRYKERNEVVNAIASHHGDVPPNCIIAELVSAADTLSAARPGARNESVENYIQRLQQLEEISSSVSGVKNAFAIQSGREVRVIVDPKTVEDVQTFKIARKIREQIEEKLNYPGTIKVTVIRETRAQDTAR